MARAGRGNGSKRAAAAGGATVVGYDAECDGTEAEQQLRRSSADAAAERVKRLAALETRLRLLLQERAVGGGGSDAAVEYVVETIVAELEANEEGAEEEEDEEAVVVEDGEGEGDEGPAVSGGGGGGICGPEDVFSVLQAFVPEEMLEGELGVEDEGDMEILVDKVWGLLLKSKVVLDPAAEDEGRVVRSNCELCGREMPLTRHHLRPRSTHRKFLKQGMPQEALNECASICRPCHSAVHRAHDNETLGQIFFTVERLLADEKVARFVAWARKVRPSLRSHKESLLYRR